MRRGAMTSTRLYGEVIPALEKRELVRIERPQGKLHIYYFRVED